MTRRKSFVTLFLFLLCASVGYAQTPSSTPERENWLPQAQRDAPPKNH